VFDRVGKETKFLPASHEGNDVNATRCPARHYFDRRTGIA
jgi:hypothetical protein